MLHNLFNIPYLISMYGYIGIFVIILLESGLFFALPGDSLLFTAGILATGLGLNIYILIPLIFVASLLGGLGGYWIGTHLVKLYKYAFFRKVISEEHLKVAEAFFERHGKSAIVISRFVPVIRTFTPIAAGVSRMNFARFTRASIVGALLWSTIVTMAGYFLGKTFPQIQNYLQYLIILVIVVSVIPAGLEWWQHRKQKAVE